MVGRTWYTIHRLRLRLRRRMARMGLFGPGTAVGAFLLVFLVLTLVMSGLNALHNRALPALSGGLSSDPNWAQGRDCLLKVLRVLSGYDFSTPDSLFRDALGLPEPGTGIGGVGRASQDGGRAHRADLDRGSAAVSGAGRDDSAFSSEGVAICEQAVSALPDSPSLVVCGTVANGSRVGGRIDIGYQAGEPSTWGGGTAAGGPGRAHRSLPEEKRIEVAVYHTHTNERYNSGGESEETGTVVDVGKELVKALWLRGVPAIQDASIHDRPSREGCYSRSRTTAARLLEQYPNLRLLLDIHRDGVEEQSYLTTVGNRSVAGILIVVGSLHSQWQRNYRLAEALHFQMEQMYPGLSRGILVKDGRYNQDLDPGCLLLEMGNFVDELEPALHSARLLADVLVQFLDTFSGESSRAPN